MLPYYIYAWLANTPLEKQSLPVAVQHICKEEEVISEKREFIRTSLKKCISPGLCISSYSSWVGITFLHQPTSLSVSLCEAQAPAQTLGVVICLISHKSQTPIHTGWQMTQSFSWRSGRPAGNEWGPVRRLMTWTRQMNWSKRSVNCPGKSKRIRPMSEGGWEAGDEGRARTLWLEEIWL